MSNLRNALTTEKAYYVDNQIYTSDARPLGMIESELDFTQPDASTRGVVPSLVKVRGEGSGDGVCLESDSMSGSAFFLVDLVSGSAAGTWYGKDVTCPTEDAELPVGFSRDAATGWK